jgi:pimeloyl-ACP methyl ester carboxylesterase
MASWVSMERDGVRLACLDYGGEGRPVLLLHGLAGHAGEWSGTAAWLTERARVVALDARGPGRSERRPEDVSQATHAEDAAFVVEQLGLGPMVLVGQSLGGVTGLLVAAERPEFVRGLVLVDASPEQGDHTEVAEVEEWLASWPVPFGSREAAIEFLGEAWANGLERREDGWWPSFDLDVMGRTIRDVVQRSHWERWEAIECPTLVVGAGKGMVDRSLGEAMRARARDARFVEISDAPHDLHLERPHEWRRALSDFLDELERRVPSGTPG